MAYLTLVTLTFNPVSPKPLWFLCCIGWICGPSMRRVGQCVLELLIGNGFGTFDPGDLDLWPSRLRRSRVNNRKRKGYRRTDGRTDRHHLRSQRNTLSRQRLHYLFSLVIVTKASFTISIITVVVFLNGNSKSSKSFSFDLHFSRRKFSTFVIINWSAISLAF